MMKVKSGKAYANELGQASDRNSITTLVENNRCRAYTHNGNFLVQIDFHYPLTLMGST